MKFDRYLDPGHGWCRVRKQKLGDLGIADKISPYSYQRGEWAYLEEDCDMPLFAHTLRAAGIEPEWRDHYADKTSKIRGYEGYKP